MSEPPDVAQTTLNDADLRTIAELAAHVLVCGPDGRALVRLGDGPVPRLVAYTHEDKAAKGLRKVGPDAAPQPPVHFSVLEMIRDQPALLLTGEAGSGRTTLVLDLTLRLTGERAGDRTHRLWSRDETLERNESGDALPQLWDGPVPVALPCRAEPDLSLRAILDRAGLGAVPAGPGLLLIDDLDRAGPGALRLLDEALALQQSHPGLRVVALADEAVAADWILPPDIARHRLLPLLAVQRRGFAARHAPALGAPGEGAFGPAAANAALFALALATKAGGETPEELVASALMAGPAGEQARLCAAAFASLSPGPEEAPALPALATPRRVRQILAGAHLAGRPPTEAGLAFAGSTVVLAPVVASMLRQLVRQGRSPGPAAIALIEAGGEVGMRGAILAAEVVEPASPEWPRIEAALVRTIEAGALTPRLREQAGRVLARHGDPRDLERLAVVPGGTFVMGCTAHPNSAPVHAVAVAPFRIGVYPVTNGQYARFVEATGRVWRSPDKARADRRNAPATDLTWRDACAYCAWLTGLWRGEGRIGAGESVRLATEPEWERAARGDQPDRGDVVVYPWDGPWNAAAANSEETGFNDTCTVGLFPAGRSPYGCLDMAGQVWEWTTTLWGEDMGTPSFAYPYRDDGREDPGAAASIRRVLRGGCFSSGPAKACCTYRGSLEPDGFWRGNGFRIVVAPDGPA